jgi:hypothetical protein
MTEQQQHPPAGWFPEDGNPASLRYWDGNAWTDHRKPSESPAPVATAPVARSMTRGEIVQPARGFGFVPGSYELRPLREDGGFVHFLRFLLIYFVMALACYILIGIVWLGFALGHTGRRARDLLMLFIPIWGTVVVVQTIWRYTAKNVYWSVRADHPSKSLFTSS